MDARCEQEGHLGRNTLWTSIYHSLAASLFSSPAHVVCTCGMLTLHVEGVQGTSKIKAAVIYVIFHISLLSSLHLLL